MAEFISTTLQTSAVTLAEELSFTAAAQKLGISTAVLHAQMSELATLLECALFREDGDSVEVTEDGRVLIDAFRSLLSDDDPETSRTAAAS